MRFVTAFAQGGRRLSVVAGAVITTLNGLGYLMDRLPGCLQDPDEPAHGDPGRVAGRQPVVLGFALEQTENDLPNLGYASMFALAVIVRSSWLNCWSRFYTKALLTYNCGKTSDGQRRRHHALGTIHRTTAVQV